MIIEKYQDYFHDGGVIAIECSDSNMELSLESAQIPPDEMTDDLLLSNFSTLKGKLHVINMSKIVENDLLVEKIDNKMYDTGDILNLKINPHGLNLLVVWRDYPPKKQKKSTVCDYIIEAEMVRWENMPDLVDPFIVPIEHYPPLLRGGQISDIRCKCENYSSQIEISMENRFPEVESQRIDHLKLSSQRALKGVLLLNWVKTVRKNAILVDNRQLTTVYDRGQILDFTIGIHKVLLTVKWTTLPPKTHQERVERIEIEAGSIDWRNEPAS